MNKEQILNQLESLKDSILVSEDGIQNSMCAKDIEALNAAIEDVEEVEKLKQEVVYYMKRCVEVERVLKEIRRSKK